jgi:hypothetical protein
MSNRRRARLPAESAFKHEDLRIQCSFFKPLKAAAPSPGHLSGHVKLFKHVWKYCTRDVLADDVILARSSRRLPLRPSNTFLPQSYFCTITKCFSLRVRQISNVLNLRPKQLLGNVSINKNRPLTNCQRRRSSYDDEENRHTSPHHVEPELSWRGTRAGRGVLVERKSALNGP